MNTTRFHLNFLELVKILKTTSFPQSQLAELAMNAALKLEELELQDRQISLQEEKTRQEIEATNNPSQKPKQASHSRSTKIHNPSRIYGKICAR